MKNIKQILLFLNLTISILILQLVFFSPLLVVVTSVYLIVYKFTLYNLILGILLLGSLTKFPPLLEFFDDKISDRIKVLVLQINSLD